MRLVGVYGDPDVLALAAAVEAGSAHPAATAVVSAARDRGLALPPVVDFADVPATACAGSSTAPRSASAAPD